MNEDINNYNVEYLRDNERQLLEQILNIHDVSLEDMRKMYIKRLPFFNEISNEEFDIVIEKIIEIVNELNVSILEFRNLYNGKPVYEIADKIIKLNKDFNIPNNRNVLQPSFKIKLDSGKALTVFEKLNTEGVYEIENIAQIMYNRLREDGLIWLDVHRET